MTFGNALALLGACAVLAYLAFTLIRPEKF